MVNKNTYISYIYQYNTTLLAQLGSIEKHFLQHSQLPKPNDYPEHDDIIMTQISIYGVVNVTSGFFFSYNKLLIVY